MSALKYWVWLAELKGLGNQARLALLHHFGGPEEIFYADPDELLLTEGITRPQAALAANHDLTEADRILADCQALDIRIMTIQDGDYPGRLQNIYDPPCLLYVKGRLPDLDEEATVAVVGTRDCTPYGKLAAERLGYGLGSGGAVVVSGLAKGIDAAAARGAVRAGARVVGVLGNGPDVKYPVSSRDLYNDLALTGALLSEYPPGTDPVGSHFPVRNRILSGLAVATLVVEAPEHSGALITAELAMEQGRDIYAVPGPIYAPNSVGCNRLIRDGAGLVMEPWDILSDYVERFPGKLRVEGTRKEPQLQELEPEERKGILPDRPACSLREICAHLSDDQMTILKAIPEDPIQVDDLIELTGIPTRRVLSALTILEIENLVQQHSGKHYTLAVTLTE